MNAQVSYMLEGPYAHLFIINSATGEIIVAVGNSGELDREEHSIILVEVDTFPITLYIEF